MARNVQNYLMFGSHSGPLSVTATPIGPSNEKPTAQVSAVTKVSVNE